MSPFIHKLRQNVRLTDADVVLLTELANPVRRVERGDIVLEGTEPRSIALVLEGWVYRYKQLANGKRQITAVFLPGDLCEPFGALPRIADYSLSASTPATLARVTSYALRTAAQTSHCIETALWCDLLVSDAIAREHMTSLGRRSATERLAHFFCETHFRLIWVSLVDQNSYIMPLTQNELADVFGLTPVHVNRSLQELRKSGLLSLRDRRLTIHDVSALRELSMFDPAYLIWQGEDVALPSAHVQR